MGGNYNFEAGDYDERNSQVEQLEAMADQAMADMSTPDDNQEYSEDYSNEIDKRLEVAAYYQQLRRGSLFTSDTEASRIVEREVRRFVQQRLEVLVGMRAAEPAPQVQVKLPFTEPQITALTVWADRLLKKDPVQEAPQKTEPAIRQASAPAPVAMPPKVLKEVPVTVQKPSPAAPPPAAKKPAKAKTEASVAPPKATKKTATKTRWELDPDDPDKLIEIEVQVGQVVPSDIQEMATGDALDMVMATASGGIARNQASSPGVGGAFSSISSLKAEALSLPAGRSYIPSEE